MFGQPQINTGLLANTPVYTPWSPYQQAPIGPMGQMFAGMAAQYIGNQIGAVPVGWNTSSNFQSVMRDMMFQQSHEAAMVEAAKRDRPAIRQAINMFPQMFGVEPGSEDAARLDRLAETTSNIMPYVGGPRGMDVIMGGRSASVLAHYMHLGGTLALDPGTRSRGVTGATSAKMAEALFNQYYARKELADGTLEDMDAWRSRTVGLSSGEMGELYVELQRRGQIQTFGDREGAIKGLRQLIENGKIHNEDYVSKAFEEAGMINKMPVDKNGTIQLGDMSDSDLQDLVAGSQTLRQGIGVAQTENIKAALDKYKGSIAAVKEIFGDMGRPNAPIPELLAALETFTHGTLQQLDEQRVEGTVRQLWKAAKATNMGMEGLSYMLSESGRTAQQLNINPVFAAQFTTGALAMREAFTTAGDAGPAWGLANVDQAMLMEQQHRARAVASPYGNAVGAVLRIADMYENDINFNQDTKGAELISQLRAISEGDLTELSPEFLAMGKDEMINLMADTTGLTRQELELEFDSSTFNQEWLYKAGKGLAAEAITAAQRTELMQDIIGTEGVGMVAQVAGMQVKRLMGGGYDEFAAQLSTTFGEELMGLTAKERHDTANRGELMADKLRGRLQQAADAGDESAAKFLETIGDSNFRLKQFANLAYGVSEDYARKNNMIGENQFFVNSIDLLDPNTRQRVRDAQEAYRSIGVDESMFSGIYESDPARRLFQTIYAAGDPNNKDKATLSYLTGETLGMIGKEELATRFYVHKKELEDEEKRLNDAIAQHKTGADERSQRAVEAYESQLEAVTKNKSQIEQFMEDQGLTPDKIPALADEEKKGNTIVFEGATIQFNGETVMVEANAQVETESPISGTPRQSTVN